MLRQVQGRKADTLQDRTQRFLGGWLFLGSHFRKLERRDKEIVTPDYSWEFVLVTHRSMGEGFLTGT